MYNSSEHTSNYILDYALLSDDNFEIGMIFKSSSTNTHYMIIPSDWTNIYLPKNKDIVKSNDTIIELNNVVEGYSIKTNITPNFYRFIQWITIASISIICKESNSTPLRLFST